MNRAIAMVLLAVALTVSGCQSADQPTPTPSDVDQYVPVVSATGVLVPAQWAALSHARGGEVLEVLVQPGDRVAADAALVVLGAADLEAALEQAQHEAAAQRALLAQVQAGSPGAVIARADRDNAHQVAQAAIALRMAEAQLAQAEGTDPQIDVAAARARVAQVEALIAQQRAQDLAPEVALAEVEVERAKIALDDTQDEYTKALDRPWEDQSIRDGWAKQLEQAQLAYRAAQARLDSARDAQRAHALGTGVLQAQLVEAQAMLDKAEEAAASHAATLDLLRGEVAAATAQLRYLRAWENPYRDEARAEEIAQVEARLAQAEAQAAHLAQQLRAATVRAPFAGTVGEVHVRAGAYLAPGQAILTLGNLDSLRVETTDLDEIDVVRVAAGQRVDVTFDAMPDRVFAGEVTRIAPVSASGGGGVHYTTWIALAEVDPGLCWGMTAFVDIEAQ
ncbi:MAG: efflux RND transporter periplasmic adaptor subunit [Anaerolineae bacterium]|nr:efflux RND transporter periplasmic adaptor subunit [Anaerolineae bacterium]